MAGRTIVGLDIGTTKIGVIIGEVDEHGQLNVVGVGTSPSDGLRKGVVVNIEKTISSIHRAVEEAELMAGVDVSDVYVGIAGEHIRSLNSRGVIAVSRSGAEITRVDVDRVIEAARAVALPPGREILHVVPQTFIVDDQTGIRDPVGMSGVRLEGEVHIVSGAVTSAQNIAKSVEKANLRVADIVLEPLASSMAVLDEDEKELGVAVIDIGGGTTDLAIFFDMCIRHTASIPLGGNNVTSDVAIGIRTPLERAEEIKRKHGCALQSMVPADDFITVPGVGGREQREVARSMLATIIEPRMTEIYRLVLREIQRNGFVDRLGAGIVLTGGGSLLPGAVELAERVFDLPVKIGVPRGFGGLVESAASPKHATGVGLVLYGYQNPPMAADSAGPSSDRFRDLLARMAGWVKQFV